MRTVHILKQPYVISARNGNLKLPVNLSKPKQAYIVRNYEKYKLI
jgi:hypothetical protein